MNTDALKRMAMATDFEAVGAFTALRTMLAASPDVAFETLAAGVPDELRHVDGQDVLQEFDTRAAEPLSAAAAVETARTLLTLAADDDALSPLVVRAFDERTDERQMVNEILAIGAVGAVWLCIASTNLRGTIKGIALDKRGLTTGQLQALADIVRALRAGRR